MKADPRIAARRRVWRAFAQAARAFADAAEAVAQEMLPDGPEYVNITTAAELLGVSHQTIARRIADGTLRKYPTGLKMSELVAYADKPVRLEGCIQPLPRSGHKGKGEAL